MIQLTRCFGLSFALHLAVASLLAVLAAREPQHPPKVVTVMLDFFEPPEPSHPLSVANPAAVPVSRVATPAAPRAVPIAEPAPRLALQARPEPVRQAVAAPQPQHSAPQPGPPATQAREPGPAAAPAVPVAGTGSTTAAPTSAAQQASPRPAAAPRPMAAPRQTADPRSATEKAQQHYLKEHFAYIRDLITTRLVYPSQARRMNWSGKAVITFTIAEDGNVQALRVVESSGHTLLDSSALETVRTVAPFPRPPVRAEIVLPINFKML